MKSTSETSGNETQLRIDLAAALRLAARADWHEGVANHFSAAVSEDGRRFLVNPRWKHFSMVRASDPPGEMEGSAWVSVCSRRCAAARPEPRAAIASS